MEIEWHKIEWCDGGKLKDPPENYSDVWLAMASKRIVKAAWNIKNFYIYVDWVPFEESDHSIAWRYREEEPEFPHHLLEENNESD